MQSIRKAFLSAQSELIAHGEFRDDPEGAARWLTGRVLLYYEKVRETWHPSEQHHAVTPIGFFRDGKFLEDSAELWDKSNEIVVVIVI